MMAISLFPTSALAYDYYGTTYNDNDFYKMQAFLNLTSDDGVHTNGYRLNPAYDPDNPTSWGFGTMVLWSSGRIVQLLLGDSGLTGSLDLSNFTGLAYADLGDNSISAVDVSGDTALRHLNVRRTAITELNASALINLNWLTCNQCPNLTDVNASGCTALETLIASGSAADSTDIGKLDTLDVSGCTALIDLSVDKNLLTALDLSGLSSLDSVDAGNNELTTLDFSDCTALRSLDVSYNKFVTLDVSGLPSLEMLNCMMNQTLTALTIKGASNLTEVTCTGCSLPTLDASGLTNLTQLGCSENKLTALNVTGDTALGYLDCSTNQLSSLSMVGIFNIGFLACSYNAIQSLDVSGLALLEFLVCDNNELTSLTGSGNTDLGLIYCSNNLLTSLDFCDSTNLSIIATDNRLSSIKLVFEGIPVTVTAKGSGYLDIYKDMDYHDYYVNAVPCTGESFLGWTDGSAAEIATTAKYDLSEGTAYNITANFTVLELISSATGGSIYTGGRITLTPNREGGTWSFDSAYLSRDGNTFTALKAGTTTATYTVGGASTSYTVTIQDSTLPLTGQDFTWAWVLAGLAALAGISVVSYVNAKRRT
jgi:LPXTG-motif cell wall-anchored protein